LSKETILKITEAEAQAKQILDAANERARELYAETQVKSQEDRELIEQRTEKELREKLDDMQHRSEEILQRSLESSKKEAELMNKAAEAHMEEAVKAIVWGIVEQCQ